MDRQAFHTLFVNLNSLTEMALTEEAAKLFEQTAVMAPQEDLSSLSQDERDARVMAGFENLDLAALDGLDLSAPIEEPVDEEQRRRQIEGHFDRANLSALEAALKRLPKHLPPLTQSLSPEQLADWLALYKDGNDALTDLAADIRRLDVSAG